MEEVQSGATSHQSEIVGSSISKYEGLIDIPVSDRIIENLISLFNYFDVYAPKMGLLYDIVTYFRFFQLLGGAFMAANLNSFEPGTLTFKAMSVLTVLFHLVPLEYRRNRGYIMCSVFNTILMIFAIYLIITAFLYKSTSKVPKVSTVALSIFMAVGPNLLIPLSAQYSALILAGNITGDVVIDFKNVYSVVSSLFVIFFWTWIIIKAYSNSLVFRPSSFASIEGSPQVKLLITTTVVTYASSMTSWFDEYPSAAMMVVSVALYIYCATTVFNCGTFIRIHHQIMVLSGCILGIILSGANLYPIFWNVPWNPLFFVIFTAAGLVTFIFVSLFIKRKIKKELGLLDQFDETEDISLFKNSKKFKQVLSTGFNYCHPSVISFKLFKIACEEWRDSLDVWSLYAKFASIYPEQGHILNFIAQNVSQIKTKDKLTQSLILNNTNYILKTRETRFTTELKSKISKLSKIFSKTKAKLRNIFDLTLQGNTNEMNTAIMRAKDAINECEVEIGHLYMQYPNNRYVARQYVNFLLDIKGDPLAGKVELDNLAKLQRGIQIKADTIHYLGMQAFSNIPEVVSVSESRNIIPDTESFTNDDLSIDDTVNYEALGSISKQIERHKVPAITFIYSTTIFSFLLMIVVPLAVICGFFPFFKSEMERPVEFMEGIAYTRNTVAILTAYIGRFLFQELDDPYNSSRKIMLPLEMIPNFDLSAFGNYKDTRNALKYIAKSVSYANLLMSKVTSYKPGNTYIEDVRDMLFANAINFTYYIDYKTPKTRETSVSEVSYMVATHVAKLCDFEKITPEVVKGPDSMTARHNNIKSMLMMTNSLQRMIEYLKHINSQYQVIFLVIMLAMIAINIIIYPTLFYFQCKKLRENRQEILITLTTLPKTVISVISAKFNKIKEGTEKILTQTSEFEINRQEESIIKLFTSISDGSTKASIEMSNGICMILIVCIACASYYLTMNCYMKSSDNLVYNSHHINYLFGAASFMFSIFASTFKIALSQYHPIFHETVVNLTEEIENVKERVPMLVDYFQMIRLGGNDKKEIPFPEMEASIRYASDAMPCKSISEPPVNLLESVHCFSAAQQLLVVSETMNKYMGLMTMATPIYPDPSEMTLQRVWQAGPIELYSSFFDKAGDEIVPIIINNLNKQGKNQTIFAVVFIFLTFFISLIIISVTKNEDNLLKFALKLFLRCPPMVIMNNARIMDLLSGNYNYVKDDQSDKHVWFSKEVVNKLNDVIIVAQEETGKILTVNSAFEEVFGIKQEQAQSMVIKDFFNEKYFIDARKDKLEKLFHQATDLTFVNSNGEKIYFEFTSSCVSEKRIFSGSNQTQNVMHEKLIADEKRKSDSMLASILPPMLVPRVQAGDKNISFSVQSATILFLDVVEFTPWCGSHDAQYVMRMLNIMFKEFDAITNAHKTMTKIKCIGDCYMAAGGIFDEVNQPAVHAKEVVDFGCLVIKKLEEINEAENEKLRIRVGVNTGGPIVAGVIGTEKPTFEILGPAINIAHEMEHHGVPMRVHISRPVYELIYGQQFEITERGEIDVKGGKMFTYLI